MLTGSNTRGNLSPVNKRKANMSNMRKTNKKQLNLNMPLEVYYKCDKFRERVGKKHVGEAAVMLLEDATRDIELTADDYKAIEEEIRKNEKARNSKN